MKRGTIDAFFAPKKKIKKAVEESAAAEEPQQPAKSAEEVDAERQQRLDEIAAMPQTTEYIPKLPPSWLEHMAEEVEKPYFKAIDQFLVSQSRKVKIFPPQDEIFSAFELCDFNNVKVVIIGQDPYHGDGQAHGLSFSVKHGVKIPPSLRNMIKEAQSCYGIKKPNHGNLEAWAKQGVLMLNAVLTVEAHQANSHQKRGWERFTDAVIKTINAKRTGVVFLLWGKPAQEKGKSINRAKHSILTCSHPSPLAATKTATPFIGSSCFKKANKCLREYGEEEIDWSVE